LQEVCQNGALYKALFLLEIGPKARRNKHHYSAFGWLIAFFWCNLSRLAAACLPATGPPGASRPRDSHE
jgi:hypothetical protein